MPIGAISSMASQLSKTVAAPSTHPEVTDSISSRLPLVLAVDDDEDSLLLLCKVLDMFHIPYRGTTNPLEALTLVQQHHPALILLDVVMPEVSGLDIIYSLKRSAKTQSIPVVAVTALAKMEDRQLLLQSGFADYLNKPYNIDDLQAMLIRYLTTAQVVEFD